MNEAAASINAEGVYEPLDPGRVPWQEFWRGERDGMRYRHLSCFGGGTQISVSVEVLPPGRQANLAHYHLLEEEQVLVLEGALTLRLGEKTFSLQEGHYVCFPAGQKAGHALSNETASPCRYLVLGNPQPHDVAVFTDTGRVSVKLTGEGYRQTATMVNWDGIAS